MFWQLTRGAALVSIVLIMVACEAVHSDTGDDQPDAAPGQPDASSPDATPIGCTSNAGCTADLPICDPQSQVCRACVAHSECASDLCDSESGACAAEDNVIYVSASSNAGSACGKRDVPCQALQAGVVQLDANHPFLRVLPGDYDLPFQISGGAVELRIYATSAIVHGHLAGPTQAMLGISSGASVFVRGMRFTGNNGDGITCDASALRALEITVDGAQGAGVAGNQCQLELLHSAFTSNQHGVSSFGKLVLDASLINKNPAGGVFFSGELHATNNLFLSNGQTSQANYDGAIRATQPTQVTVAYNTFVDNWVAYNPIVACGGSPTSGIGTASSNLFAANHSAFDQDPGNMGTVGECAVVSKNLADRTMAQPGNFEGQAGFVNEAGGDYHLSPASLALDKGEPSLAPNHDWDNAPRPVGTGPDLGAFERQ